MENQDLNWRKSNRSNGGANACVETASVTGVVLVRDTTDRDGGTLAIGADAWRAFTTGIRQR